MPRTIVPNVQMNTHGIYKYLSLACGTWCTSLGYSSGQHLAQAPQILKTSYICEWFIITLMHQTVPMLALALLEGFHREQNGR